MSSRRSLETNVVIHDTFEGCPGRSRLTEVDGVGSPVQARSRHVKAELPVQTVDTVSRDGIVIAEAARRQARLLIRIVDPDLQKFEID